MKIQYKIYTVRVTKRAWPIVKKALTEGRYMITAMGEQDNVPFNEVQMHYAQRVLMQAAIERHNRRIK